MTSPIRRIEQALAAILADLDAGEPVDRHAIFIVHAQAEEQAHAEEIGLIRTVGG